MLLMFLPECADSLSAMSNILWLSHQTENQKNTKQVLWNAKLYFRILKVSMALAGSKFLWQLTWK